MNTVLVVGGGLLLGLIALIYNQLVRASLRVKEAWGAVEVQLQRRASLIPNLVEVVKGYAGHERDTLARVTSARTHLDAARGPQQAAAANDDLTGALGRLFAIAEAYPDLKANEQFGRLQADLADTENKIAYARNYYNGAVETYNTRVQTVPGLFVAGPFGFAASEFFKADSAAREPVRASLGA
jgi:LemA protein